MTKLIDTLSESYEPFAKSDDMLSYTDKKHALEVTKRNQWRNQGSPMDILVAKLEKPKTAARLQA